MTSAMEQTYPVMAFIALLAITDPVGAMPLFLTFTENIKKHRLQIARQTALAMTVILCVAALAGEPILTLFSISLASFRVAGGILLMIIALGMMQAQPRRLRQPPEEEQEAIESTSVSVVPLAMPLLAGPGAISTVILFSSQATGMAQRGELLVVCAVVGLITWALLRQTVRLEKHLSQTMINIFMRVMGLIIGAIAVEFIAAGLRELLPGLA